MKENRIKYTVKEKIQETKNVFTLRLSCDAGVPKYYAGQFITVYFDDAGNAEGKAYTISSAPHEQTLNITVKGVGQFSNKLCAMNTGDKVEASLPYGYFYSEEENTTLVMIAGGMGIAPFRSIIMDSVAKNKKREMFLFNSNKNVSDIVFGDELKKVQQENGFFKFKNYITQQDVNEEGIKNERIKVFDILEETKNIENKEFLICGSIPFVRDFWKGLKEGGVKEETIYTEAIF